MAEFYAAEPTDALKDAMDEFVAGLSTEPGALHMKIDAHAGTKTVLVGFGGGIEGLALTPQEARTVAGLLIRSANRIDPLDN